MSKLSEFKITKRGVDALPTDKDAVYRDSDLKGFAVRVKPSGTKIYLVRYRNRAGVERSVSLGQHGALTAEEARNAAKVVLGKVAAGEDPSGDRAAERDAESVCDLWEMYREAVQLGIDEPTKAVIRGRGGHPKRAASLKTDASMFKRHVLPLIGRFKVRDLKPKDVSKWMVDITVGKTALVEKTGRQGKARVTGGAGVATRALGLLGSMMNYAILVGIIETNPCKGMRRTPTKRRRVRLSPEQYLALGDALRRAEDEGEPWQAIEGIWVIALTGCRKSEIARLKPEEVDVSGHALRLTETKTGESIRPIGGAALNILKPRLGNHQFVFYGPHDEDSYYRSLPEAWRRVMARVDPAVKMPHLTLHGLRHAFASQAGDLGFGILTIKELIGHAPGTDVTEGYIHQLNSLLIAAADKVSAAISSYMTGTATALSSQALVEDQVENGAFLWEPTAGGQLVSLQEAAVMLGVGRPTIEKLIEKGDLTAITHGKQRRVEVAEVLAFRRANPMPGRTSLGEKLEAEGDVRDLLSAEEAAMVLRVGRPTLMKLIAIGRLPAVKVGARFRVAVKDVIAYRTEHRGRRGDIDMTVALL
jgi:excisionase family DNA binding protein